MNKILLGMMAVFVSVVAMADNPTISGVMVQQRWPWSRLVDIDYVLDCDLEQAMDITVRAYNGNTLLDLPAASFSGDLSGVSCGARRIVWDPSMTSYANSGALPEFRVELTPTLVPLYMIVDLTKSPGDAGQIDYVYETELTNGVWGAWVRNPVTNRGSVVESVVWTGVTTNDVYKTDKLVLRRIAKGSFAMGGGNPPALSATLRKDFYAGVFLITQRQWELIMGDKPSSYKNPDWYMTRPVERVSYDNIRGAMNSVPSIDWPATGSAVLPSSFVGKLRAQTGIFSIDLPTEAQGEYACRADTTTLFNDGDALANESGANANTNAWLDALGRYKFNGGWVDDGNGVVTRPAADCGPENGTAPVGSYLPNAWGLYDTLGNVFEWCLDWHHANVGGGVDPTGPESGTVRVRRGGCHYYIANVSLPAARYPEVPSILNNLIGLRIVSTLP